MTEGIRGGNRVLAVFCDGSVQMLPSDSMELLKSILTKNGREVIEIPRGSGN